MHALRIISNKIKKKNKKIKKVGKMTWLPIISKCDTWSHFVTMELSINRHWTVMTVNLVSQPCLLERVSH
jgi:hypothetical protein